ncbi:Ankyrin repeat domain-containing protein [Plasmodiophora brassicae]|uniref:Uncharacterized protein n=1 Tax=Plasmodiophora brassicae TaxID=37360 RepID=A0A0G4IU47_PLABS|nr:hypothetical protein PBRA_006871 [Plasmodiophora brassicae]SPR00613.1 unnamed protein product [Plasmodiophora brassicae]
MSISNLIRPSGTTATSLILVTGLFAGILHVAMASPPHGTNDDSAATCPGDTDGHPAFAASDINSWDVIAAMSCGRSTQGSAQQAVDRAPGMVRLMQTARTATERRAIADKLREHLLTCSGRPVAIGSLICRARWHDRQSLLHWAAFHGEKDIAEFVLSAPGVAVNARGASRRTPLHLAAHQGNCDIVELLMTTPGIDFNPRDKDRRLPLHLAVMNEKHKVVKILVRDAGLVNINGLDSNGKTPLECAIEGWNAWPSDTGLRIVQDLLKAGCLLGTKDYTVLYWAVNNNHSRIATKLLKKQWIDVNAGGQRMPSPLYQAVETQNSDMVRLLLKHRKIDPNRDNPLLLAVETESYDMINMLLKHWQIDVHRGILKAVKNGAPEIAELLINKCPMLDVTSQAFRNALVIAKRQQYADLISLMEELGARPCGRLERSVSSTRAALQELYPLSVASLHSVLGSMHIRKR